MQIVSFITGLLVLTSSAYADSLFDTLQRRENAARAQAAQEVKDQELARNGQRFQAYLARILGMPGAEVISEGLGASFHGDALQYNVGGVWGCNVYIQVPSQGIECINAQTGKHRRFRNSF